MDVPNIDTMAEQWRTFLSAPYIILPSAIILAVATWWFRGTMFQPTIAGLKAEMAGLREQIKVFGAQQTIFDAQMQLATRELAFERNQHEILARQINGLTEEGNDAFSAKVAKLEAVLNELVASSNVMSSAISTAVGTLAATEMGDWFTNIPLALQAEADKERAK